MLKFLQSIFGPSEDEKRYRDLERELVVSVKEILGTISGHHHETLKDIYYDLPYAERIDYGNLGDAFHWGRELPVNKNMAFACYLLGADAGDIESMYSLGFYYSLGFGVTDVNEEQGVIYYKSAAHDGHPGALYSLGWCYMKGKGVPKNEAMALWCFEESANKEYHKAQNTLGYLYRMGIGVEKNVKEALKWYKKAEKSTNYYISIRAKTSIAFIYLDETSDCYNLAKGVKLMKDAAEQGDKDAMYDIAWRYDTGNGLEQNDKEALRWYKMAANKDHSKAIESLIAFYKEGRGMQKPNIKKSEEFAAKHRELTPQNT